jgi:hypothetical protein
VDPFFSWIELPREAPYMSQKDIMTYDPKFLKYMEKSMKYFNFRMWKYS